MLFCNGERILGFANRANPVKGSTMTCDGIANILPILGREFRRERSEDLYRVSPDADTIFASVIGVNALPYKRTLN